MAPQKPAVEHIIERTPEYEELIANLRAFHESRGTSFDAEPKMGNINVDLLKLFNHILHNGGYDKVSEEKLKWRQMCDELGLSRTNAPADAYALKQIFYKNLAAYEIKMIHKKEPPPPEILEFVTAKGGSLLTRTLENFPARGKQPGAPESPRPGSIDNSTPARDRKADEPSGTGRASRGLREAPPQRIPFTPDTNSSRATRHTSTQQHTTNSSAPTSHPQAHSQAHLPSHAHSMPPQQSQQMQGASLRGSSHAFNPPNPEFQNDSVQNFQPPPMPSVQLRKVATPSSNLEAFEKKQRLEKQAPTDTTPAASLRHALPAGNLEGPNIYERCLLSLRSGIRAEQAFALSHLVKISCERGDKYKFSQFPGLADGLIEKGLEVGSLFYYVDWTISFDPEKGAMDQLDGMKGTSDILERIAKLKPKPILDDVQSAEFSEQLGLIKEAALVIRNMVMLQDNAYNMAEFPSLKDLLCIILNLPNQDAVVELKHDALDIAEHLMPFFTSDAKDPLYRSLLSQLASDDRGVILTALRAITRIAVNSSTEVNKLEGVPETVLQNIMGWLLLNDDDLMDACLDFLYQYTAVVPNLDQLLACTRVEHLVVHLVRLLSHGAKRVYKDFVVVPERREAVAETSDEVASLPRDLVDLMLGLDEPHRCHEWITCLFEEHAESSVTQIAIWNAYNASFLDGLKKTARPMMNAAEFIRNISHVYKTAGAQIVLDPGDVQKFIINGIRPRPRPFYKGREYMGCPWRLTVGQPARCGAWLLTPESLYDHILVDHLGVTRGDDGKFPNNEGAYTCEWGSCTKYSVPTKMRLVVLMSHVKTHIMGEARSLGSLGSASGDAGGPPSFKLAKSREIVTPAKILTLPFEETPVVRDERNPNAPPQPGGIPFTAVLVLCNIARNVGKTKADEALRNEAENGGEPGGWSERLFRPVRERIFQVFSENKVLAENVWMLLELIEAARP